VNDIIRDVQNAVRGIVPEARPCEDATDLAFWFWLTARALRAQRESREPRSYVVTRHVVVFDPGMIRNVRTEVRVRVLPADDALAYRGRTLPDVRR
jgi:hypothetical protein